MRGARAAPRKYVAVVFSEAYLTSGVSRRTSWRWLLPFFGLLAPVAWILLSYLFQDVVLYGVTALYVVLFLAASRMKVTNLLPDILIMSAVFIAEVSYLPTFPSNVFHTGSFGINLLPLDILAMAALGVHSSVLCLYAVTMAIYVKLSSQTTLVEVVSIPYMMLVCQVVCIAAEYGIASLFSELQVQLATIRRLLDGATDGFCTMDLVTQTMVSASPGLTDTLGCSCLVGTRLTDFVAANDKEKLAFNIGRDHLGEIDLSPMLVTCHCRSDPGGTPTGIFDAQIYPYDLCESQLHLFVKVLGEVRKIYDGLGLGAGGHEHGDESTATGQSIEECSDFDSMWESSSQVPKASGLSTIEEELTSELAARSASSLNYTASCPTASVTSFISSVQTSLAYSASTVSQDSSASFTFSEVPAATLQKHCLEIRAVTDAGVQTDMGFLELSQSVGGLVQHRGMPSPECISSGSRGSGLQGLSILSL